MGIESGRADQVVLREFLINMIARNLDKEEGGEVWFPSVDMTFAYEEVPLHEPTKNRIFQIARGKSTGTYRVTTGCYRFTVLPTEFQKLMDLTLVKTNSVLRQRFWFYCNKRNQEWTFNQSERSHESIVSGKFTGECRKMRVSSREHRLVRSQTNKNRHLPGKCKSPRNKR